jgi:NTP pyrophosphatase (non-canonical NTP hydrolase)
MMPLTREERLVVLIEECGEVIQAATKCLRFGWDRDHPDYGVNHEVLAREVGDLIAMIDSLNLREDLIEAHRARKLEKAERVKAMFGV